MAALKAWNLEEQLEDVAHAPVCALVGEDDALRSHCLRLLRQSAAPADLPGSTIREFDEVPEAHDVFDELRTIPFLGLQGRRVVVVERGDAFLAEHWRLLGEYLRSPSRTGTLMLCLDKLDAKRPPGKACEDTEQEKKRAKAWRALVKALGARGAIVDCRTPRRWDDARGWMRTEAGRMGKKLTPRAASALLGGVGPNILALQQELAKLSAYVEPEVTVTERDVAEMVVQARSRRVFDLGNAVARGDVSEALHLCEQLLLGGMRREVIISVLALQVRQIWQIKRLHAEGVAEREITRRTGLPGFVVRRSLKVLDRFSDEFLAHQLEVLYGADIESKTTSLRSHEERAWLERVLVELCPGVGERQAAGG